MYKFLYVLTEERKDAIMCYQVFFKWHVLLRILFFKQTSSSNMDYY